MIATNSGWDIYQSEEQPAERFDNISVQKKFAFDAASNHNIDQIKAYVAFGGDINICDEDGISLFTKFVRSYHGENLPEDKAAYDTHTEFDYAFWDSFTPKYWFIPMEQRPSGIQEKLDFFFEHGVDPNLCKMVDGMTETALMWSVVQQDYYLTKYLLEHNADPGVHLFNKSTYDSPDGKEYWLMDHLDIYIMDGDKDELAQVDLAVAQLLWEYGLKNWNGYCISVDPQKGVTGGHSMRMLF